MNETERLVFRRLGVFSGPFPLEPAERVVSSPDGIAAVEVFDVVSRLVDKSLVVVSEPGDGAPRYRLLESLRTYARNRARDNSEIVALLQAHASWWLDWLDERRTVLPTDGTLDLIEEFHGNLREALDWALDQPDIGLRLLERLARAWIPSGRSGDAMAAADRLLTEPNAERYPQEWLAAAILSTSMIFITGRYQPDLPLLRRAEQLATSLGDTFHAALAPWFSHMTVETSLAALDQAREHGDRYYERWAILTLAVLDADGDPATVRARLNSPEVADVAAKATILQSMATRPEVIAAMGTGDLGRAVEVARELAQARSTITVDDAARHLSQGGLGMSSM